MRKPQWAALAALLGTFGLVLAAGPARSQRPDEKEQPTFKKRLVKATRLPEKNVELFLSKLGPAVRDHLRAGEQVELPGLGTFRVVRVPEHRDLVRGRPATIPASNYVEFLPTGGLVDAANGPGAVPAETVPPFEYNPLPDRTPGTRVPTTRQGGRRTQ